MKKPLLALSLCFLALTGCGEDNPSMNGIERTAGMVGQNAPLSCQSIADACAAAGFTPGNWQTGDGYWRNCVNPILQGQTGTVAGNSKPLPTVDSSLVTSCKDATAGKFGSGQVGSGAPTETKEAAPAAESK